MHIVQLFLFKKFVESFFSPAIARDVVLSMHAAYQLIKKNWHLTQIV